MPFASKNIWRACSRETHLELNRVGDERRAVVRPGDEPEPQLGVVRQLDGDSPALHDTFTNIARF